MLTFLQVIAVAGRSLDRAKEFAAHFSVAKAYGSYEQLAQDNDVDIVYVGTIHPTHYDCSMKMLEYNKHVLCEKPITMNGIQTKKLIETARSKKLFLMEVSGIMCNVMMNLLVTLGILDTIFSSSFEDEGIDCKWYHRRCQPSPD